MFTVAASAHAAPAEQAAPTTDAILKAFAEDYRADPMALTADFGVKIGDDWWSIGIVSHQKPVPYKEEYTFHEYGPQDVSLKKGKPKTPTWYFEFAAKSVLEDVYAGRMTAGTGAMRSFPGDKVMVDIKDMDGFTSSQGDEAIAYLALTHFWAMGAPEITTFGRDQSLPTHGVGAVSLYTMKDKRLAWFSIMKDEVANAEQALEAGQVPNLFIVTKGKGKADFGNGAIDIGEGMSIFVAPYVKHVIYNPYDEPLEGILVLYGDNSDFAYGKSYMDLVHDQNAFLGSYPFKQE
jgi:mannose-6-phosphate isomerase-like protein (cupin superfamily)